MIARAAAEPGPALNPGYGKSVFHRLLVDVRERSRHFRTRNGYDVHLVATPNELRIIFTGPATGLVHDQRIYAAKIYDADHVLVRNLDQGHEVETVRSDIPDLLLKLVALATRDFNAKFNKSVRAPAYAAAEPARGGASAFYSLHDRAWDEVQPLRKTRNGEVCQLCAMAGGQLLVRFGKDDHRDRWDAYTVIEDNGLISIWRRQSNMRQRIYIPARLSNIRGKSEQEIEHLLFSLCGAEHFKRETTTQAFAVLASAPDITVAAIRFRNTPEVTPMLQHKARFSGTIAGYRYNLRLDGDRYVGVFNNTKREVPVWITFAPSVVRKDEGAPALKLELVSPTNVGYEFYYATVEPVRNSSEYSVQKAIESTARRLADHRHTVLPWDGNE